MRLPFKILNISKDKQYDELFLPKVNGWLGGDAGCSIRLSQNRILWLFGDTIIGKLEEGNRKVLFPHINNSIAITTLGSDIETKFYWNSKNGFPSSFFPRTPLGEDIYYWPTNGLLVKENLLIFCYVVRGNFKGDYLDFWNTIDTGLIVIKNFHDDPKSWKMDYKDLGLGNDDFGIHSALHYSEPKIYFLGYTKDKALSKNAFLAKIDEEVIIRSRSINSLKYYNKKTSKFENQISSAQHFRLFSPGNTESSICYLKSRDLFICTTYDPLSCKLFILTSNKITGPWSGPFVVYENPDHVTMTYSFRIHHALMSDENTIIFSYITSPNADIRNEAVDLKFYRPRFLRMDID